MLNSKERIVLGLSGGVDSSYSLILLKIQGYDVIAVTMRLYNGEARLKRAKDLAERFGVKHIVVDLREEFEREIIGDFVKSYLEGRTPNPCVRCNRIIKFEHLIKIADQMGVQYVATGHYARVGEVSGEKVILKGVDREKDQSYFLAMIRKEWLRRIIFPLGELRKKTVIMRAEKQGVVFTGESQELCFLAGEDYRSFLRKRIGEKEGLILDKEGNVLGKHRGIFRYTLGQRRKLGIALGKPMYVVKIDPRENIIVVGEYRDVFKNKMIVEDLNFFIEPEDGGYEVKIRNLHKPAKAQVRFENKRALVKFERPQFAPTPGQLAAFYRGEVLYGGGFILSVEE